MKLKASRGVKFCVNVQVSHPKQSKAKLCIRLFDTCTAHLNGLKFQLVA